MKIKALYKYVYTFVDEKGFKYPYRYSWHLLSCFVFFCYYEDIMIYLMQIAKCFFKYQPCLLENYVVYAQGRVATIFMLPQL